MESDKSTSRGSNSFRSAGVGHYAALRCIRCSGVIGSTAGRHNWRGVKMAHFCSQCDDWWRVKHELAK